MRHSFDAPNQFNGKTRLEPTNRNPDYLNGVHKQMFAKHIVTSVILLRNIFDEYLKIAHGTKLRDKFLISIRLQSGPMIGHAHSMK